MADGVGHPYSCCFDSLASSASLSTTLNIGPSAGKRAELQLTFPSLKAPELVGLNLVFQILGSLEQCSFKGAVSPLRVQGRTVQQQACLTRVAGGLDMHSRPWNLEPNLHPESRLCFPLVFEDDVGGGYCRQGLQVFELFLHVPVPGGLSVEPEIVHGGFHIRSGPGLASSVSEVRHPSDNLLNLRFMICAINSRCLARHRLPSPVKDVGRARPLRAHHHILGGTTMRKHPPFASTRLSGNSPIQKQAMALPLIPRKIICYFLTAGDNTPVR